jgi:hypothetical protein
MKLRGLATLALIASIQPTLAADPQLTGMAEEVLASEWSEPTKLGNADLFGALRFPNAPAQDRFDMSFSPLSAVATLFGGTPQTGEIFEGMPVTWLCYESDGKRTTFASYAESLVGVPAIDLIVEEVVTTHSAACTNNAAAASPDPLTGLPGVGGKLGALQDRYRNIAPDAAGRLALVTEMDVRGSFKGTETKIAYFRFDGDTITGVAYTRRFDVEP